MIELYNTYPLSYIDNVYKELIRKLSDVQDERDLILKWVVINGIPESTKDAMEQLEQLSQRMEFFDNDISSLKKRIKHSKSPLEKKNLEKQLNLAYKSRKKRNRNGG